MQRKFDNEWIEITNLKGKLCTFGIDKILKFKNEILCQKVRKIMIALKRGWGEVRARIFK